MSRITKWKLEKTKVKAVFRLQFHATDVPQSGWDKLFISVISTDSGKATAKTTKASVRSGTCKWADPIYETTKLLQNSKSKQYDEKLCKLVVAMGSSRASILGEAIVNLADYADASKPCAIALPLQGCNFGTMLHITVQLLTSKTGFREFEKQRELRERGFQAGVDGDGGTGKISSSGENSINQMDKEKGIIRLRTDAKELSSVEEDMSLDEEYADSGVGFDGSSNTSESLYPEKHETSSTHEIDSLKSMVSDDLNGLSCCQSLRIEKGDSSDHQIMAQGSSDSAQRWSSDNSIDNEFAMAREENNRLNGGLELAESSILDLKLEVSSLQSLADELGIETRKFSDLIVTEKSSVEELTKEVFVMKSECLLFKEDIERLKDLKLSPQITIKETSINQDNHLLQNVQVEWLEKISVVEDTIRELQNKAYVGFHENDSRFIYSELETVLTIIRDIKCGNGEAVQMGEQYLSANRFSSNSFQPESILHRFSIPTPVSQVPNSIGVIDTTKSKILDLVRGLDEAKVEREGLLKKMNQMECYYEALIQELEENQKRMIGELQSLRNEHSTCLYTISADRAEIESMRQDMNNQVLQFADERRGLDALNKELEKRAATSEAALRRARLNYSIAVDKLQKDLELLSSQVVSMFETNENIIKHAFPESPPRNLLGRPKILQSQEDYDATKLLQYQNQNLGPRKQLAGGDILLEDLKRSLYLQEGLYQKVEEELGETHSVNLNLDIYSKTLQETLLEANAEIYTINGKIYELAEELELSNDVKNQLTVRLQKAMDDIQTLNEYKSSCSAQCSDMALQNQILEDKLESISKENFLLAQKLTDCKELVTEYKSYQSKFETCLSENAELSLLLKHEASENTNLRNEISLLKENLRLLKAESDELASIKEKLQENICFVKDKLATLLSSYSKQFRGLAFFSNSKCLDECTDFKDAILQLEEIQHNAYGKILQMLDEKKNLESERVTAEMSLTAARSEILTMKQKFKGDMQDMAAKLVVSNALVNNLQVQFESVADKFHHASEIEERSAKQNRELLDYLALLQDQMQELTSKNGHIAQEMLGLDILAEELGSNKSTITELIQDNQYLRVSLQDKTGESIELASEIGCLEEDLRNLRNELQIEKGFKDELEGKIRDLASQLNKECDKVIYFEQQKTELTRFRQVASDLELEKSRLCHLLEQQNGFMEKLQKSSSRTTDLESRLFEMQDYSIAADVKLVYITNQYETLLEKHVRKFEGDMKDMAAKLVVSNALVDNLQVQLESVADKFHLTSEIEEKSAQQNRELLADLALLQDQMQELTSKNGHIAQDMLGLDALAEELKRNNSTITELIKDKKDLMVSFQDRTGESMELASEVSCLKENLINLHEELCIEKGFKDELEEKIADLKVKLNKEHDRALNFEQQNTELMHFRRVASDLELEKSRLSHHLAQQNEFMERLRKNSSHTNDLESQLFEMLDYSIAADVKLAYVTNQYEIILQELVQQLNSSDGCLLELQKRYHVMEAILNQQLASEAHVTEENANLLTSFKTLRTEFEASVAQNKLLSDSNNDIKYQLEEYERKLTMMQTSFSKDNLQAAMIEQLKDTLAEAEEDIRHLTFLNEELEILSIVFKGKVDEQYAYVTSLEDNRDELLMLQSRCNELSHKLSEQIMKTEEFKNLSIHLKELKDKAQAEFSHAHEKREPEGPPVIMQDSLRIAFIKEHYETKIQELKQQLSISKKHGEEMLMKLQDSIDEIENRKKSEAVNLKRNNELSLKLLELETELQSVLAEKREKVNACDRINAELECVTLSLECCKEEKEKLEASFRECEGEKSRLAVELDSIKELEKFRSSSTVQKEENNEAAEVDYVLNESCRNSSPKFFCSMCSKEMSNLKSLNVNNDHLATQRLKSSMEHMHEELEKMKTENTQFLKDRDFDPDFQDPEELVQLHKVNNELRSMFPSFNEISSGNALERVLALEIELAESLKTKNKLNIHFQSSFLKQHSDEEAVFKSFRDINDLIKQMLEIKGSRAAVQAELREMHDRYSQLSLQFAEVEGERQKLKMALKNIRASRKLVSPSPSSSLDL